MEYANSTVLEFYMGYRMLQFQIESRSLDFGVLAIIIGSSWCRTHSLESNSTDVAIWFDWWMMVMFVRVWNELRENAIRIKWLDRNMLGSFESRDSFSTGDESWFELNGIRLMLFLTFASRSNWGRRVQYFEFESLLFQHFDKLYPSSSWGTFLWKVSML